MEPNCVVVDLETTGLDPKTDKIIEIGALKIRNGEITDSFSRLVNPGRKLEERIVEITGITDKELENAFYIEEILPENDLVVLLYDIMQLVMQKSCEECESNI